MGEINYWLERAQKAEAELTELRAKIAAVEALVTSWEQSAAVPVRSAMRDWQERHASQIRDVLGGEATP